MAGTDVKKKSRTCDAPLTVPQVNTTQNKQVLVVAVPWLVPGAPGKGPCQGDGPPGAPENDPTSISFQEKLRENRTRGGRFKTLIFGMGSAASRDVLAGEGGAKEKSSEDIGETLCCLSVEFCGRVTST